jgi:molecular chaperone DnaK (HSP70)
MARLKLKCRLTLTPTAFARRRQRQKAPANSKITIKANTGLSEAEIQQMVKDAEPECRRRQEEAGAGKLKPG